MRFIALAALGLAAVATAACAPPGARKRTALTPVSRLTCPQEQGRLTRVSVAEDGQACTYTDGRGGEVRLRLLPVSGGPEEVLDPLETEIRRLVPIDRPTLAELRRPEADAEAAEDAAAAASAPGRHGREEVSISLPGLAIEAKDERARIRVGPLHIDADGENDRVQMQGHSEHRGQFTIDAGDEGAIIRARGRGPNVRATLVVASDRPGPEGWRAAGYEALGPRSGPLVVATVKLRRGEHDEVFGDVKALVRRSARSKGPA